MAIALLTFAVQGKNKVATKLVWLVVHFGRRQLLLTSDRGLLMPKHLHSYCSSKSFLSNQENLTCCFFGKKRFGIVIRRHQHETCEKIHGENVHSEEASLPTCASIDAMHLSLNDLIFSLKIKQIRFDCSLFFPYLMHFTKRIFR